MSPPVLLIAFNRPEPFERVLTNLVAAHGVTERDVFVYVDGPRNDDDKVRCDRVADVVERFRAQLPRLAIVRRDRNLGCRVNVVKAITEVLETHGRVIVVEDDVLVSHTFLDYMDAALELYHGDPRIWSVNAWRNRFVHVPASYGRDVYLTPRMTCWGWGTWKDRWEGVDFDLADWPTLGNTPAMRTRLDAAGVDLQRMLQLQYDGQLNTWDVQCCYHVVKNGLFCVEPRLPLTKNIGSGVDPTHCIDEDTVVSHAAYYDFRPQLVANLDPDERLLRQFPHALFNPSLVARIHRRLFRHFLRYTSRHDECSIV